MLRNMRKSRYRLLKSIRQNKVPKVIVLLHTSYHEPVPYSAMHHFVIKMCTWHAFVTKWCIVGYLSHALLVCELGLLQLIQMSTSTNKWDLWQQFQDYIRWHWLNDSYHLKDNFITHRIKVIVTRVSWSTILKWMSESLVINQLEWIIL